MKQPFTGHVRSLAQGSEIADDVLDALREALRQQLRRRGILNLSPSLLGYPGRNRHGEEPMNDLVHDCYVFSILQRFRALKNQLKQRSNIDGFVVQNIRHFLTEKQKRANPTRYALFKNLEAALSQLAGSGVLRIEGLEEKRIHADCIFQTADISPSEPVSATGIHEAVSANKDSSRLIAGLGTVNVGAPEAACQIIEAILAAGIRRFRLRDLIDVVADEISVTDAARVESAGDDRVWDESGEGCWRQIRIIRPDGSYEEQEQLNSIVKQMRGAIDELDRQVSVRKRIRRVFDFIVDCVRNGGDLEKLTYAHVGRELKIARATLGEDVIELRKLSEQISSSR